MPQQHKCVKAVCNLNKTKQSLKSRIRVLVISLLGIVIFYRKIGEIDNTFIMDSIINFGLEFIFIVFLIWTIFKDRNDYRKNNIWTAFLPTIIGFIIIIGFESTLYIFDLRDKSPVKFSCVSKIVDFNGVHIDFREDGTYKLDNYCFGSNFYRGKYSMHDSTITLDKSNIDKVIESDRLLIRADGDKDSNGIVIKSIYQIDKQGKVINGAVDYRILENPK